MTDLALAAVRGGVPGGVVLLNAADTTGYSVLDGVQWGNYSPDIIYSRRKDGSSRATDYDLPPRLVQMKVRIEGTTYAQALGRVNALMREVNACQRSGATLRYKANAATNPVYLTVRGAGFTAPDLLTNRMQNLFVTDGDLFLQCDPAAVGDDMEFRDSFVVDSSADWDRTDAGGGASISGGKLSFSGNGLKLGRHTGRGYNYTDVQVTLKVTTGASVTSGQWAVAARCQGATSATDTALLARIIAGTNQVQFLKVEAGTPATPFATAAFTPAVNTTYWIRLRLKGALGTAEVFTFEPKPLDTPTATTTPVPLSAADQQAFVSGPCGYRLNVVAFAGERFDDFDVRPYTFRCTSPDVLRLTGIPGDLPALIRPEITVPDTLATQAVFGGVFWAERQRQVNLCWNGNLEQTAAGDTPGWYATTVAGVITGAGIGPLRSTVFSKFGLASLQFVAAANEGLNFPMPRRFKHGRTYLATGWLKSNSGVGSSDLLLGVNGDMGTPIASALTSTFTLRTCVWTPTADRDIAYLAVRHISATPETVHADGMGVFEVTPQTQNGGINASVTTMVLTAVPPEGNPAAPCVFVLEPGTANQELVRGAAVAADGVTWTIDRGWDGSIAATHATATAAYALPAYWFDANSDGVHGSMLDVIGLANPYGVAGITDTMNANAALRSGFGAASSFAVTQMAVSILIDPSTCVPPDFSGDELLIEVWARFSISANPPNPRFVTYSVGEEGTSVPIRYDLENGSGGLSILSPTNVVNRFVRLGIVPIRFSDLQQRRRMQIILEYDITAAGTAISFDYVMLLPSGQRATSPTGILDDAGYPDFLLDINLQQTRRIFPDYASEVGRARETMASGNLNPAGGIIGHEPALAFAAPNADALVKLSNLVPNGGTAADASELLSLASEATLSLSFGITPRYLTLR